VTAITLALSLSTIKRQGKMPSKRQSKQAGSHSIDLGNQNAHDLQSDSTKSGLLSNGAGYDVDEDKKAEKLQETEKATELSSSDVKAIALLVVLCKYFKKETSGWREARMDDSVM
jgi:hypothetical protein